MSRAPAPREPQPVWWLVHADGLRVPVRSGLLVGRHAECDVVIDNEHVSRRHAHVGVTASGLELVPLGRNPVTVNGVARAAAVALHAGDVIAIGDVPLRVEPGAPIALAAGWLVGRGAASASLRRVPFAIGGDERDDLVVPGWPPALAVLYRADNALFVAVDQEGLVHGERALAPGAIEPLVDGDRLAFGDDAVIVRQAPGADGAPTRPLVLLPDRVELRILPRGARLTLSFGADDRSLLVAERRLELLSALLRPAAPHAPGDYIPDAVIIDHVWPRSARADTSDLHVLVHRLRRDLVKAGIHGLAIIAREPNGAGTRFTLRRETRVVITP